MRHKNRILNILLLLYCIAAIGLSGWFFSGSSIRLNQPRLIDDNQRLFMLMDENIPVRISISDKRWGSREITEKQKVLSLWERIKGVPQSSLEQSSNFKPLRDEDIISGSVLFLNGSKDFFEVSNYIRRNGLLYGGETTSFEITLLYNELQDCLFTKENLQNLVTKSAHQVAVNELGGEKLILDQGGREQLSAAIGECRTITDPGELEAAKTSMGSLKTLVSIYLERPGQFQEELADFIVWIAVYESGYAVVNNMQTGGAVLHLEGALAGCCEKLLHP